MPVLQHDLFTNANQYCLDDPAVDEATKRQIRAGQLNVTGRLEQAATSDPHHITAPQSGPHVRIVHRALIRLRNAKPISASESGLPPSECDAFNRMVAELRRGPVISDQELRSGTYGPSTQGLVFTYKKARDIRRTPGSPVDNIVGIQTTKSLDADLLLTDRRALPPRPEPSRRPRDIFIKFSGFGQPAQEGQPDPTTERMFRTTFDTPAYRKTHGELAVITFFGGRQNLDPTARVVRQVQLIRSAAPDGITVITAFSAGGFSAANTAARLTELGIPLHFVGIADGAFFAEHGDIANPDPTQIRLPGHVKTQAALNVFQTFGHRTLKKASVPNQHGIAPGTEWHGALTGLSPREITPANNAVLAGLAALRQRMPLADSDSTLMVRKKTLADPAHIEAVRVGEFENDRIVRKLFVP